MSVNVNEYRTSDLYVASVLKAFGFKFLEIREDFDKKRKVFIFENSTPMSEYTTEDVVEQYFSNELDSSDLKIKDVLDNIKFFKLKIHE